MTRGAHNIRSGLDMRWINAYHENYNNGGGLVQFNRDFTRSTLNSNDALEGNAFASFLLGAPSGGDGGRQPEAALRVVLLGAVDPGRLARQQQDDASTSASAGTSMASVTEADNMLNYAFDPTIVNPVSARVGQQVMGGIRFAGVDGAPDRPWKYDKNNYQFRVGTAYQLNEKTVFRAGYGKYFLNPTSQGEQQPDSACRRRSSRRTTAAARRPMRWSNPWPNGIQDPPGSSLGPETFLGRGPTTSNPDFVVPNVHQFSAGIQRELPWRISLEATYAGSRSYDIEGNFGGFNEPSAEFQAQCDVTLGGSRSFCDQTLPNPFLGVAGFEGTNRFTSTTLSRFELARPFPAFTGFGYNQQNLGTMKYDSMQLVANKRWARGVTINTSYTWVPRWTEDGANTTTGIGNAYVDEVLLPEEPWSVLLAPQAPRRLRQACGSCPWYRNERSIAGLLLGGWSIAPMLVFQSGQPWDMPGNVELAPGVNLDNVALPGKKDGQFIYGVKPCIGQRQANGTYYAAVGLAGVRLHRALLPDPRGVPAPHDDVPLRRVPPAVVLAGGRELREDHADHRHRAVPAASRGVQPLQQPAVRRAATTTTTPTRRTSAASTATSRVSRTSSASSSWDSA